VTIQELAQIIEDQHAEHDAIQFPKAPREKAVVKAGKRWTKIDIGTSGKLMVETATGEIYGIKAYGVPHLKHHYGNLGTVNDYWWGDYYPRKKS
jgi:hypothetical protein